MAEHVKVISFGDALAQADDLVGVEFDDPPAAPADHVIVGLLAETDLVMGTVGVEADLLENAAVNQQRERPVDGGLAHGLVALAEVLEHLIGLEMTVDRQHGVEDLGPSDRILDTVLPQVRAKRFARLVSVLFASFANHVVFGRDSIPQ